MKKSLLALLVSLPISFYTYAQTATDAIIPHALIKTERLNINSSFSDIGAVSVDDKVYFSTYRNEDPKKNKPAKKRYYDLFEITIDSAGNPKGNAQIVKEFSSYFHDGPATWCEKTGELFVTQSNNSNPNTIYGFTNRDLLTLKILVAKRTNNKWEITKEFPYNSLEYSVAHPALTQNGDTMVFSSDMPGGQGAADLYLSTRNQSGQWSKPQNMGRRINTVGKEEFPFIVNGLDGKTYLIFASDKEPGFGGLDIYYTELNKKTAEIIPFSAPINSEKDDFGLTIDMKRGFGYFSSNRNEIYNDDIYKFSFPLPLALSRTLHVIDKASKKPIKVATIDIDGYDPFFTDKEGRVTFTPKTETEISVKAAAFGYKDNAIELVQLDAYNAPVSNDTIWLEMITNQNIVLHNIYYDFNSWEILPEAAQELDKLASLMNENQEMTVQLGSHTDSRGTKSFNRKLSKYRAEAAAAYIVSKGIAPERIKAFGYGESKPVVNCHNWKDCTPTQNRANRRTEIYIPGFGEAKHIQQEKGDFSSDAKTKSPVTRTIEAIMHEKVVEANVQSDEFDYYLIFGAFSTIENANKEIENLKKFGVDAKVLNDTPLFRVGAGVNNLKTAKALKSKFSSKYPDAWIL